jgi:hypothetical protein
VVVIALNLLYTSRSSPPHEAEYSRKTEAVDDDLQWTNRALISNVGKVVRRNKARAPNSMVEASRCGLELREDYI